MISGAATKNGHAISTANGHAFENGERVQMTDFDFEEQDRDFVEQQREIGRREVKLDGFKILQEGVDRIAEDKCPILAADCYKFAAGITDKSEVEIAAKHADYAYLNTGQLKTFRSTKPAEQVANLESSIQFLVKAGILILPNISKQAVCKRVKQWSKIIGKLGLPPAASMRTEKACKTFKKVTTESWKQQKKRAVANQVKSTDDQMSNMLDMKCR
jgi:hypothetical protein